MVIFGTRGNQGGCSRTVSRKIPYGAQGWGSVQRFFTGKLKPYMRLTPWERQRAIFVEYEREGKNQLEKDSVNDETLVTLSCWFANGLILGGLCGFGLGLGATGTLPLPDCATRTTGILPGPSGWSQECGNASCSFLAVSLSAA